MKPLQHKFMALKAPVGKAGASGSEISLNPSSGPSSRMDDHTYGSSHHIHGDSGQTRLLEMGLLADLLVPVGACWCLMSLHEIMSAVSTLFQVQVHRTTWYGSIYYNIRGIRLLTKMKILQLHSFTVENLGYQQYQDLYLSSTL